MWNEFEADEFLDKVSKKGSVLGLSNMENLMQELGNIQEKLRVIHVAGTNGKGSCCAMIESVLRKCKYRTGRYSSPKVFCYEEIYQINGEPISRDDFLQVLERVAEACEKLEEKGLDTPTLFEVETAVAFLWFYQNECDVVLLETGLGGSLDATNIIKKPLCSVITSVSRDHMAILGDTLSEIAANKAGIIKEGRPLITVSQEPEVMEVFRRVCAEKHSERIVADRERIVEKGYEKGLLFFDYGNRKDLALSLLGAYQPENAACAIAVCETLGEMGFEIPEDILREGLREARWPGRFEIVCQAPLTILDGAHNEDAAKKLRKTLEMGFTNYKFIYIIGVLADKEHEKMLKIMLPLAERVYTITPDHPRALAGELLCREAAKYHKNVICAASLSEAWKRAKEIARVLSFAEEEPMILVFGSLSYLGEMKQTIGRE